MIAELTRKLYSTLSGNTTLATLTQGVYFRQAPQGQQYPYVTFFPVSEPAIHTHTSIIDDTRWQFSVFSLSEVTLSSIHGQIKTVLDNVTLGLGTLAQVGILREGAGPLLVDNTDEQGIVYHQPQDYRILVE